jgi:hypothetical protein
MQRHNAREARVIPVILRECDWHTAPFGRLVAAPCSLISALNLIDQKSINRQDLIAGSTADSSCEPIPKGRDTQRLSLPLVFGRCTLSDRVWSDGRLLERKHYRFATQVSPCWSALGIRMVHGPTNSAKQLSVCAVSRSQMSRRRESQKDSITLGNTEMKELPAKERGAARFPRPCSR